MKHRWKRLTLAMVFGMMLGWIAAVGGTHGVSGESETERYTKQAFFFMPLYELRGDPDQVRAIEQAWNMRVLRGCTTVGGLLGLAAAFFFSKRRHV